ncbi:MAG TPA: hypothetical protein DCM64_03880 [Gammaproteobacteria bacterium]|nr:hypothetical protein [Gammaproteobacteria bacterium]
MVALIQRFGSTLNPNIHCHVAFTIYISCSAEPGQYESHYSQSLHALFLSDNCTFVQWEI